MNRRLFSASGSLASGRERPACSQPVLRTGERDYVSFRCCVKATRLGEPTDTGRVPACGWFTTGCYADNAVCSGEVRYL
jgi:hypothetical protein